MKIKYTLITLFTVILGNIAFSQYAFNSSVFNQTPSLFNVATTATGAEDMSFCTSFKMQHLTLTGTPLRSNTLVTEFKISDGPMSKNHFGIGLNLVNEQTGESKLMSTDIAIPINYSIQMNQFAKLTIGAAPGLILQSYDPTLPTWESDWNGSSFSWTYGDPTFINSSLSRSSYASFNVNTGMHYQYTNRNKSKYYGGLAINHINKPKMNFSESSDKMFMQMVVNLGADLSTSRRDLRVQPQFMAFKNGPNSNVIMGVMFENILSNGSDITNILKSKSINYGAYYRWKDAISLNLNYKVSHFRFGVALDVTASRLSSANKGFGSVELFFKSMHLYGKKKNKIG